MPVNSTHPEYKKYVGQWTMCRDAVAGEPAIKSAGSAYLPMLTGHIKTGMDGLNAYAAYKDRALWFGATDRTLTGYVGAIMRKDPTVVVPKKIESRLEDITDAGQTVEQFIHTLCRELLTTGRFGLLVDKDAGDPNELAFIKLYYPENILNWRVEDDVLTLVTLQEHVMVSSPHDEYEMQEVQQVRELRLEDGVYVSRLHRLQGESWVQVSEEVPTFRNTPLDHIPFTFVSADEDSISCSKPPIYDLASCNINHYQLDADYRHGLHFTALPTPVFTGVDEDRAYFLGSEGAINLRNENSRAFFLEFQGLGLSAIKEAMQERKDQMASLGAQLLSRKTGGRTVETAEAARIQHAGETSLLSTVVGRVEEGLECALEDVARWEGVAITEESEVIEVTINRDFIDANLDAQEINALVKSWQDGGISPEVLFWNLQKGGVIDPKKTYEEYLAELDAEKTRRLKQATALAAANAPGGPLAPGQDGGSTMPGQAGSGPDAAGGGSGAPGKPKGLEKGANTEE
jgi:hypothetical protein